MAMTDQPPDDDGAPEWWKNVSGMFTGILPKKAPEKPAVDMNRWTPTLEAAGYSADSPEHKLLTAIAGHVNSAPLPQETSGAGKAIGTGLGALGAGLARGAGASVEGALGPSNTMAARWGQQQDAREKAKLDVWKAGGDLMIPQVQNAVQNASNQKLAAASLARTRGRLYGTPAPEAAPASAEGAAPAAPGATPGAQPAAVAPAGHAPTGAPTVSEAAPGVTRGEPGRSPDEPQYPLAPNSPIRFHLPDSAAQARVIMDQVIEENAARVRAGTSKQSPEDALKQEANTPGSTLSKLIADDRAAYLATPAYKGRAAEAEKYAAGRVEAGAARLKTHQEEGETVKQSEYDLDLFETALNEASKRNGDGNATGWGADWKLTATKAAKALGWTSADVGPEEVMKDWGNRVAGQAAKELTNRVTQSEFKIYRDSVPALTNTETGNRGIIAASRALNDAKKARIQAENEYLAMMEDRGQTPVLDHRSDAYVNAKSKAAFDEAHAKFRNLIDLAKQQQTAKGTAGAEEQLAPTQLVSARTRARDLIAGGMDPAQAAAQARQELTAPKSGAPAKLGAPAPTAEEPIPPRPTGTGIMDKISSKAWDWGPEGQRKREEEMRRIRGTIPQGP